MKMKKIISYTAIGSIGMLTMFVFGVYSNVIKLPITRTVHNSYAANYGDNSELLENAGTIFVGKVLKKIGNDSERPSTQFLVEVILSIKGDLKDKVIISQQIGYKRGLLYVSEGDTVRVKETDDGDDSWFLQPGSTYFFATGEFFSKKGWYILYTHPNARKLISADGRVSTEALQNIARQDRKVNEFLEMAQLKIESQ